MPTHFRILLTAGAPRPLNSTRALLILPLPRIPPVVQLAPRGGRIGATRDGTRASHERPEGLTGLCDRMRDYASCTTLFGSR
jgi:hypothetical protein